MKKIIFLLILAIAFVGFMPAMETAQPPWDTVLTAEMSVFGVDGYFVTTDTAPEVAPIVMVLSVEYPFYIKNTERFSLIKPIDTGQRLVCSSSNSIEYWLRV